MTMRPAIITIARQLLKVNILLRDGQETVDILPGTPKVVIIVVKILFQWNGLVGTSEQYMAPLKHLGQRVNCHSTSRTTLFSPLGLTVAKSPPLPLTDRWPITALETTHPPCDKQTSSRNIWSGDFHVLSNRFKHLHRGHYTYGQTVQRLESHFRPTFIASSLGRKTKISLYQGKQKMCKCETWCGLPFSKIAEVRITGTKWREIKTVVIRKTLRRRIEEECETPMSQHIFAYSHDYS
jgi:hypothetical protein